MTVDQIVEKYRSLLRENGMYLLHNDLLCKEDRNFLDDVDEATSIIKYDELLELENAQIMERLRKARFVILGGLGFSGYNPVFNANQGIYRQTIDRAAEIEETVKFETLYHRLLPVLSKKNTVILTHTPISVYSGIAGSAVPKPILKIHKAFGRRCRQFACGNRTYRNQPFATDLLGYRNL